MSDTISDMNRNPLYRSIFLCLLVSAVCSFFPTGSARAQAAGGGSVAFVAQVKPGDGQPEPVRQLSFYLLTKSISEIRADVEHIQPPTDMNGFIDGLKVSPELKNWMKAHHRVDLVGTDFTKEITPEDIVDIPEFLVAYKAQNDAALTNAVPAPKPPKPGSKAKDMDKYQQALKDYHQALLRYLHANKDSFEGMDADLGDQNPEGLWVQVQNEQEGRIRSQTLKLAQTRYLAAKTNSDLDGRGVFSNVAPGEYWITTLDTSAMAGDQRLGWDVSVTVRPGQSARIELSNLNAMDTSEADKQ